MKITNAITKNVIFNTVGKIWTVVASLVFVPVYIKLLGEEAYGIVTFFAVMQSVLNLMGVGLQKTLRREFANSKDSNSLSQNQRKYKLLRSSELVYFFVCLLIILICSFGSSFISNQWLNYETLNPNDVSLTISLMGGSIGFQLIANLYLGCIFGLDYQGEANIFQVIWITLKNAGVIAVLAILSKSIISFYLWNDLIDLLYCVLLRFVVLKHIPVGKECRWHFRDLKNLKNIWKYAAGLFLISIGSIFNTQLDKLFLSKFLPVIDCGAYNSTYHLASFASYVPTIVGTAIFSNIASLLFDNKQQEAKDIFSSVNKKSVIIVSALSSYIAVFSYELLYIWTGITYANIMCYAAPFVVIGFALNAFQQVPYDYLLASGKTKLNQIQVFCCIPYVIFITFYMTRRFGVLGAALAWAFEMLISTTIYLYFFFKESFGNGGVKWLFKDVYLIFLCSIFLAIISKVILSLIGLGIIVNTVFAIVLGGMSLILLFYVFDRGSFQYYFSKVSHILKVKK